MNPRGQNPAPRADPAAPALLAAQRALRAGDPSGALAALGALPAAIAADWRVRHHAGLAHLARGDDLDAVRALEAAAANPACVPEVYHALARARLSCGDTSKAITVLERAHKRWPAHAPTAARLAEMLIVDRRHDEAARAIEPLLSAQPADPLVLVAYARLSRETGSERDAAERLRQCLQRPGLDPFARARCLYRLAGLHDALGEHSEAAQAVAAASALKRGPHDPDAYQRWVDALIANWNEPAWERARADGASNGIPPALDRPIFIVGMPRSGSTLVEQVLSAHPLVSAGGEHLAMQRTIDEVVVAGRDRVGLVFQPGWMTPDVIGRAAERYTQRVRALMKPSAHAAAGATGAARATDKMLSNFQHAGPIRLMFPDAAIIHCVRHPLDTCLSCHFQDFTSGNVFAQDLMWLGRYFNDYARLMRHWASLPGMNIVTVRYEQLVADPENESRRLIDAYGLDWHDDCLRPHEHKGAARTASAQQVSKPVYRTSVARWKHYRGYLAPLIATLDASLVQSDEGEAAAG